MAAVLGGPAPCFPVERGGERAFREGATGAAPCSVEGVRESRRVPAPLSARARAADRRQGGGFGNATAGRVPALATPSCGGDDTSPSAPALGRWKDVGIASEHVVFTLPPVIAVPV